MKNNSIWKDKRVLITGHTGFKGGWLSVWLNHLGAKLYGIALDPPTEPNFFSVSNIQSLFELDARIDIRNFNELAQSIHSVKPDIVFHLAAQPLVQYSYDFPLETYAVNVMGTAHLLEALRTCDSVRAAVIVTTDKCYENYEKMDPYREIDNLGGKDPYSSSKACAELVTHAYRTSYFSHEASPLIATARAGNVIGGGDWAENRLIPDCIRAYSSKNSMLLRYPDAIRPWQHVLESIHGYIMLAEHLLDHFGSSYAEAWNFGPEEEDMCSVGEVATQICRLLDIPIKLPMQHQQRHEAKILRLDSTKAKQRLNWYPRWRLQKSIAETVAWYRHWMKGGNMLEFNRLQIQHFCQTELLHMTEN